MKDFGVSLEAWVLTALDHPWAWRVLGALGIVVVGIWLARWLARIIGRLMSRFGVEGILANFLRNLGYAIALVIVFIAALDFAGVPTTSLLAVLGAAGLGVGLAMKDSLSNIASGVMLIVLRPFRAGDSVLVAGQEGVVESVRIFHTQMVTADNRTIILPNSQITNAPITNYTGRGDRRVDLPLSMAFGEDFASLREALLAIANRHSRVRQVPPPEVVILALGERLVSLQLRAWAQAGDYNIVHAELLEAIFADFSRRGLRAPLPAVPVNAIEGSDPMLSAPHPAGP